MNTDDQVTKDRIHKAAEEEFLEKGFQNASLRNIAKLAGVTTGSFYWHYKNKEDLFDSIVGEHYLHLLSMHDAVASDFAKLNPSEQMLHMDEGGRKCFAEMLEYMYEHKRVFLILINGSAGTKYENMLHELTEREIASTEKFMNSIQTEEKQYEKIPVKLLHIIISGRFAGLFELIIHDIPIESARKYVIQLYDFYTAGFVYTMGIRLPDSMSMKGI